MLAVTSPSDEEIEKWKDYPRPLNVSFINANPPSDLVGNVKKTFERKFPEISDLFGGVLPMPVAIVAGGPSLNLDEVREFKKRGHIFSSGSVHDYLLKNDIVPDFAVFMDAYPDMASLVNCSNEQVNYLVCSACDPALFEKLEGRRIFIYHCWADIPEVDALYQGKFALHGGGSCTVRAYLLALYLGYRDINFFGFDCSFPEECASQHAYGVPDEQISEQVGITVIESGKRYITSTGFIVQARDFLNVHKELAKHNVTINGNGLIADLFRLRSV